MTERFNPKSLLHEALTSANLSKVLRYVEKFEQGSPFPPIQVKRLPNGNFQVIDGIHRCFAALILREEIEGYIQDEN